MYDDVRQRRLERRHIPKVEQCLRDLRVARFGEGQRFKDLVDRSMLMLMRLENCDAHGTDELTEGHLAVDGDAQWHDCLLYTSDAADDLLCVDLGGRRII